jgi:hypothetical protein
MNPQTHPNPIPPPDGEGTKLSFPFRGKVGMGVGVARQCIRLLILAMMAGAAGAQTYKWVDERGVTTYGNQPPAGRAATLVDAQPRGPVDLTNIQQKPVEADVRRRVDMRSPPPPAPAPAPALAVPPAHGMPFDTFIRLERGMSEGELLSRAGQPDQASVDDVQAGIVKLFYYYPTSSDPFITVVTVRGGRIANLERTRKF